MSATFCKTVSGRLVDLARPDWSEISLDDLARGISQTNRFCGQTRRTISVAEHSLVVKELVPPHLALAALLHDAHEALMGDITTPAAEALALEIGAKFRWAIVRVKMRLDIAIARAVFEAAGVRAEEGLIWAAQEVANEMRHDQVKFADSEALRLEDTIRGEGAYTQGLSPALSAAADFYGVLALSTATLSASWKSAVLWHAREWQVARGAE